MFVDAMGTDVESSNPAQGTWLEDATLVLGPSFPSEAPGFMGTGLANTFGL
jgi:hypothetical protein